MHHKCRNRNVIQFYGITKAPEDEYAMVIKHAKYGDLRNYIRKFFSILNWTEKAKILIKLSKALNSIHQMNLLHRDFHCKNILVDEDHRILINDFDLCQYTDLIIEDSNVLQGVLPYIAPEVLRRKPYTKQSEVYSISMIMWELTSKKPPFSNWVHDIELALAILDGMRPKIIEGTPEFYVEIMKKCWDIDPLKRPDASLLPEIFEEMMELCKMFDNNLHSPKLEIPPDIVNNSNENSAASVYITEAYKYSLGTLSITEKLQDDDDDEFDIEEKKITKEFSIELTNRLKYYELQSRFISSSIDINSSSIIEEKIVKKYEDDRLRKKKHRKSSEDSDKRVRKLHKYQKAGKIYKRKLRRSQILEDDDESASASQVSESEDSRYATQTYDFTLDDLNKSYTEL